MEKTNKKQQIISKVILFGDSGAGKTSIINQNIYKDFYSLGVIRCDFPYKIFTISQDFIVKMQIWDPCS